MGTTLLGPRACIDLEIVAQTAICAARRAGVIQHENFRHNQTVTASEQHDVKLVIDRLCERAIIEEIHETFPSHAILSEEEGFIETESPYYWIIDPLDGTVNYFQGLAYYCTSVSCYRKPLEFQMGDDVSSLGEPLVGVVYAEQTDELFTAVRGRGAKLNGRALDCPKVASLSEAVLSVSIGSKPEIQRYSAQLILDIAPKVRKIRSCGATAMDLVNVAVGRFNALIQRRVRSWDLAAASLILTEAGGKINARSIGKHQWDIVASSAPLIDAIDGLAQLQ